MRSYTGERYTQHSTGVPDQQDGFREFFAQFLAKHPKRDMRVLRSLEDGPFVFVHVFQSLDDGAARWVTMDIFDTDEHDRIIEHWDVIEAYVDDTPSGVDMLGGPERAQDLEHTVANKRLVKEFVKRVLTAGKLDELDELVTEDIVQHTPGLACGREALRAALGDGSLGSTEMLFLLLGEGDLVCTLSKVLRGADEHAVIDLYRVEQSRIAEHWAVSEPILPRAEWGNSGKF